MNINYDANQHNQIRNILVKITLELELIIG